MKASFNARVIAVLVFALLVVDDVSQGHEVRNPVLEFCTGTWCSWCPCGHDIVKNTILPVFPDAIVLAYHGLDEFSDFPGNGIVSGLGFSGYPTGIIDRTSVPLSRSVWFATMTSRFSVAPTVHISVQKTFDKSSRSLDLVVSVTPLTNLVKQYFLSLVVTEDSLIAPQAGNASCAGGVLYVHDHVVRAMLNGYRGDTLNNVPGWTKGATIQKTYQYSVPNTMVARLCKISAIVYEMATPLSNAEIQQAGQWDLLGTTDVSNAHHSQSPPAFALHQNYPNPFNPSTTIRYELPKPSHVTLKIFNTLGGEVATLVDEVKQPGTYTVDFDGAGLSSGVYFCRLEAGSFAQTRKLVLLR